MSNTVLSVEIVEFLIPVAISVILALVISVLAQRGVPSVKMFMLILSIAISAFVVEGALPEYSLGLSALALAMIWFGGRGA